jgi:hypothetical protein
MPQLQIIKRESDGGVQAASNSIANLNQSIQRRQELAIQKMQADINAKNAQTETEKLKWDQRKQIIASLEKATEQGMVQNPQYLKMMGQAYGDSIWDHFSEMASNLPQTPENQQRLATATKYGEEARNLEDLRANPGGRLNAMMNSINGGQGRGFTPGSTVNLDPITGETKFNLQLNPKISNVEADSIAAGKNISAVMPSINQAIDAGLFGKSSQERTAKQLAVESDSALPTSFSTALGDFRSSYNVLRRASLFDEAGKALTGPEKAEALRLLELKGKTDEQIKRDLGMLAAKNANKVAAILGGTTAAQGDSTGVTVVERRVTKDGRKLEKLSDGTIREAK